MKINIVRRNFIKPSTPTPQNLKNYKLSFIDELSPPSNFGVVLFYQSKPTTKPANVLLEESLSGILPRFYPLAGRYIDEDFSVDCVDQGAEFVEAVAEGDDVEVDDLLPRRGDQFTGPTDPLLSVQVTELVKCGTLAVGVSVSHKVFDASSIGTFIAAWSNASKNFGGEEGIGVVPNFDPHLLFPGKKRSYFGEMMPSETNGEMKPSETNHQTTTIVSKLFSFKKESITNLRSKLNPKQAFNNTIFSKVRLVSAVIAKAMIRIDGRPSLILQAVNVRPRTAPPLPVHSCGNLALHSVAKCPHGADGLGLEEIACVMSEAIEKTVSDCVKLESRGYEEVVIGAEAGLIEGMMSSGMSYLSFSDWSRFGLYDADFGWGKPSSVGIARVPYERATVLVNDGDGGGIEAWVHLSLDDMVCFEEDDEIKLYASGKM
ncbi:pelargonidin 3-O-(6-caffeoylglucoside) 5-O-(6-O-malonylglucoside) 4'''-malonyltransferase-like [Salvia hispanica]|uniref:pelargonidin 3-O-(6-caffeoylglucoside) 5-O-(6-O-malonylglucoside) 4'''-malonyltransferase-like n=1 Tax=Salvia hispanica TaxID=49212 RepID=UPI0020099CEC|nr:pelargonidin 3-O-(6-caffeoylglucoside) 5-O-(6-O-malonylglucoside) 4'''-malonyltransferase-like [Salvia hispanica]